jgi:hypothetical protein
VHTVVETAMFDAAAKREGLDEDEVFAIIDKLSAEPEAGDVIPGTGGCRKLRLPCSRKRQERRLSHRDLLLGPEHAALPADDVQQGTAGRSVSEGPQRPQAAFLGSGRELPSP